MLLADSPARIAQGRTQPPQPPDRLPETGVRASRFLGSHRRRGRTTGEPRRPKPRGELASVVRFVIEIAARDDPPHGNIAAEAAIGYEAAELVRLERRYPRSADLAQGRQAIEERDVSPSFRDGDGAGLSHYRGELAARG